MTIIAAALRELIAAGVTGDALVTAIERIEAARSASMSQAAKRQALYRERQKALKHNVMSQRNVTSQHNEISDDLSLTKKDKKDKKERERGSRIAADWKPSDKDRDFGLAQGLASKEVGREAEKFRDYWNARAGATGIKLDWSATWRNWLRRITEPQRPNGKAPANVAIGEQVNGYEWTGNRWKQIGS